MTEENIVKATRLISGVEKHKDTSGSGYSFGFVVELETESGHKLFYTLSNHRKRDAVARLDKMQFPCNVNGMKYCPENGTITVMLFSGGLL